VLLFDNSNVTKWYFELDFEGLYDKDWQAMFFEGSSEWRPTRRYEIFRRALSSDSDPEALKSLPVRDGPILLGTWAQVAAAEH
jgi:hypothetical protein